MKEKIGDFIIKSNQASFSLNYSRNSKDKFDIITSGFLALLILGFTLFMTFGLDDRGFSGFDIFITIILFVGSFYWLMSFFSKISQPVNKIIFYNDSSRKLTIRNNLFKKTVINHSDINKLEYQLHSDSIQLDTTKTKNRYWLELCIVTKEQDKILTFIVNNDKILDSGDDIIRKKLLNKAKPLIDRISKLLKVESRYDKNIVYEK